MNDDTEEQTHTRFTGAVIPRVLPSPASPLSQSLLPQEVHVRTPDMNHGGAYSFSGSMTGDITLPANALLIFTPEDQFVIRGLRLSLTISTTLAAGATGYIGLFTNRVGTALGLIATIAAFAGEHVVDTVLAWDEVVDLREGQRTRGALYLAGSRGIGAGVITAHGQVYGTDVTSG